MRTTVIQVGFTMMSCVAMVVGTLASVSAAAVVPEVMDHADGDDGADGDDERDERSDDVIPPSGDDASPVIVVPRFLPHFLPPGRTVVDQPLPSDDADADVDADADDDSDLRTAAERAEAHRLAAWAREIVATVPDAELMTSTERDAAEREAAAVRARTEGTEEWWTARLAALADEERTVRDVATCWSAIESRVLRRCPRFGDELMASVREKIDFGEIVHDAYTTGEWDTLVELELSALSEVSSEMQLATARAVTA